MGFVERATSRYIALTGLFDPRRRLIAKEIMRIAGILPRPLGSVVDVGAGRAPYRKSLACSRYITAEIDQTCRPAVFADARSLPFRRGTVDLVVLTEVLEHVAEAEEVVRETARILRHEGWVILSVPLLFGEHDNVDYHRWTGDGISRLLAPHFKIIELVRNGGILVSMAEALFFVPVVLLGLDREPRFAYCVANRLWRQALWKLVLVGVLVMVRLSLLPPMALMVALDAIDRDKKWTTGYVVLARKTS